MGMHSIGIYDTLSGEPIDIVHPSGGRWRASQTDVGSGQHVFQLRDPDTAMPRADVRDTFTDWSRTLVHLEDGVPMYGGVIIRTDCDADSAVLTVNTSEIAIIFSKRHVVGVDEFDPKGKFEVVGKSPRGLVRAIVRAGAFRPVPGNWTMPFRYPADEAGSVSKEWFHHQLMKIEDMLAEVAGMVGSVRLYLKPALDARGWLVWDVVIGDPLLPGGTIDAPYSVEESIVTNLHEIRDGSKRLTGVLMIGSGGGEDMNVGKAGATVAPTIPYLDDSRSAKQPKKETDLKSLADGEMAVHEFAVEQYSLDLMHGFTADGQPLFTMSDAVPGGRIMLDTRGHEWMLDQQRELYVLAVSHDLSQPQLLKPEVQAV